MADNNPDLSLKNAKWFARELGNFSPKEQETLLRTQDFGEFEKILFDKGVLNSIGLWQGRIDLQNQAALGVRIPITPGKAQAAKTQPAGLGLVGAAGAGLGLFVPSKTPKYDDIKKNADEYARRSADEWEKKQKKKPDLSKFKTKQEAYEAAQRQTHDNIALFYEPQANEWVKTHGDNRLAAALDRKKVQHEVYRKNKKWTYQDYKDTVKGYADRAVSDWDKDPFKSVGRQQAYDRAERDIHDTFVGSHLSGKRAKEWAVQYNDPGLIAAVERKRQQDEALAIAKQGRISKALGRNPAAKFAPPAIVQAATQTPIPANTFPRVGPPNTLRNRQAPTAAPSIITSKGSIQQTTKSVFTNAMLDNNNPAQISRAKKLLGRDVLSQKEQDEIFMSHSGRITEAERLLSRKLGPSERLAILKAHYVGHGETGKDGGAAEAFNYNQNQISQKAEILKKAGLDRQQRRVIIEAGIAGGGTPLPPNTLRNIGAPNVLRGTQPATTSTAKTAWDPLSQNTLGRVGSPNVLQGAQSPTKAPKPTGFRGRLSYFGPRSIARRVRGRIISSRLGKRLASSRMGRFAGKANRLGGMASKATRRIKNIFNPIKYLERLILRSGLVSLASGFASSAVAVLGATITATITTITAVTGVVGTIAALVGGISLAAMAKVIAVIAVVALIIALIGAIIGGICRIPFIDLVPGFSEYCQSDEPGSEDVEYIYFQGGYAYIEGPNGCTGDCNFNKGDTVTMTVHVSINKERFEKGDPNDLSKVKAIVALYTEYFNNISTTGNPEESTNTANGIQFYKWSFGSLSAGDNNFVFTITGTIASETGETIVQLSMEGVDFTIDPDDCSKYTDRNSKQGNFGDPDCSYTNQGLAQLLQEVDRNNSTFWYLIAECESSKWPNAYFLCPEGKTWPDEGCTPEEKGAWGLFQMGWVKPNNPPYYGGGAGPWIDQAHGAINRNKLVNNESFDYWACEEVVCRANSHMCRGDQYVSKN